MRRDWWGDRRKPAPHSSLHPSPFTLHRSPFTPSPFTLHRSPFTLHCSPFTHPTSLLDLYPRVHDDLRELLRFGADELTELLGRSGRGLEPHAFEPGRHVRHLQHLHGRG